MKKIHNNVLLFPTPPEDPEAKTIVVQIGDERFAIHWEIEELPPISLLMPWRRGIEKITGEIANPEDD